MPLISKLSDEDVSSRYEAMDTGQSGPLFIEYDANDRHTNRAVLVRVLRPSLARPLLVEAMAREIDRASRLKHPAIERVLDIFFVRNTVAIVNEPRRGADIQQRLGRIGAFPVAYTLDVAITIAEAVAEAHKANLVHGSLEAADIRLSAEGIVKLCGLGVRSALCAVPPDERPGFLAGAALPTREGDIRRFGLLLHRVLTGSAGAEDVELAAGPQAINPKVPTSLSNLIRCLAVEPARYPNMESVIRDLRAIRSAVRTGDPMPDIAPPSPAGSGGRSGQRPRPSRTEEVDRSHRVLTSLPVRANGRRASRHTAGTRAAVSVAANGIRRAAAGAAQTTVRRPRRPPSLRRLTVRFLFLVTFLALACGGLLAGAIFYLSYVSETPEVPVPYLRGKSVDKAKEIVSSLGLRLAVDPYPTFDPHVPVGDILRQVPEPGTHTKAPRAIRVFLSAGSRTVVVPATVGKPLEDAVKLIEDAGLTYKNNGDVNSPVVSYGDVLKQWPAPGKVIGRGSPVFVKVSAGPSQQDLEAVAPPSIPVDRNITFTVPPGPEPPPTRANAGSPPHHVVDIKEVDPGGSERTLWHGPAASGETVSQDVTVDPYFELKIYLDGKELHTRAAPSGSADAGSTGSVSGSPPGRG